MTVSTEFRPRRRRSRAELVPRIKEAARDLFARKGYAATTKEIAAEAGVSETLLFLYFHNKEKLFEDVISSPFSAMLLELRSLPSGDTKRRGQSVDYMTGRAFQILDENSDILRAILLSPSVDNQQLRIPELGIFLDESFQENLLHYASAGIDPPPNLEIEIRLSFGMILASVLLKMWLFPVAPERDDLIMALQKLVGRSIEIRVAAGEQIEG